MHTRTRLSVRLGVLLLLLLMSSAPVIAQSGAQDTGQKLVREYSIGDGYLAREIEDGARRYTLVKFPDRMVGSENPCSYVLFAEAMHVSLLRIFGPTAFVHNEPKIDTTETPAGRIFYADTKDNHRVEIVIMVSDLSARHPIGVRLEKLPLVTKDF